MNMTGKKAPDFTLYNTQKEQVSLSDLRGNNVVLLFFPLAFTSTCTRELCMTRDDLASYNDLNAVVFGISVDSLHVLRKYKEELSLNFELLSDFNREISAKYNSIYEIFSYGMKGVGKRSAFVIDGKGIIRHAEILENAGEIPDFAKVKEALKLCARESKQAD